MAERPSADVVLAGDLFRGPRRCRFHRMRSAAVPQFGRIHLHPAPNKTWVHFHAAFGQKFGNVFVRQGTPQVPADAQHNHLTREMAFFERIPRVDCHQLLPYQTSIPKFAMEPCRVPQTIPDHSFFPLGSDAVSVAIFWRRAGEAARKGHRRFPQDQPSCTRSPSSGVWAFSPSCNPAFHSKCGPARRITSGTATS
jgi:hypothetical protein